MTTLDDEASLAAAEAEASDAARRLGEITRRLRATEPGRASRDLEFQRRDVQADLREASTRVQNIKAARFAAGTLPTPPRRPSPRRRPTNRTHR